MNKRTASMLGMSGLLVVGLLGCSRISKNTGKVLANVAGEKITEGQFRDVVHAVTGDPKKAEELLTNDKLKEQRNQFLKTFALQKAMLKMASAEKMDKELKYKLQLEDNAARIYFQGLMERRASKAEPTEAQLKALYDELVGMRKAEGAKGIPPYESVKSQMPTIWKQRQDQNLTEQLFKEIKQKYPITYADGYAPAQP